MKRYRYNPVERAFLENSVIPCAVYQYVDERVVTLVLSKGFLDLFELEEGEEAYALMDNDMYRLSHPDDIPRIKEVAASFAEERSGYNVVYRSRKNGEYHIIHAFGQHFYPEPGVRLAMVWYVDEGLYVGYDVMHDDSLTKNYSISLFESTLNRKANYDFLTGLPNMTYFYELAKNRRVKAYEDSKHCSMCYANLNGMSHYNKKFGFSEGDKLLRLFADLLIKYFGNENSCRIAQDSFAFFVLSDHLERNLDSMFMEYEVMTGKRGASIRVGIYPDTMGVVETSLACDRAKYACNTIRDSRRSAYVRYDKTMQEREAIRQYVIDHLDQALEEGWIRAYYQPIVRTATGQVCDEEALARWIDPVKGMLSPADFIPLLEDAGLIYKVDLYMVDQILKKMKTQSEMGLYVVPTSVNLSRTDFDACDMVNEICSKVDAAGLSRKLLTIEITESVIGSDFDFMKKQVERFRSLGFQVWMDDFGSGYSSLDVLQSIHFDVIKLDMRFMKQFDNDEKSRVIITELMKMAFGLGVETVSEGVERADQVEFLAEVGCTKIQGYYYCKPISSDEVFRRYEEGRQIGFENPEESDYYSAIGKINLYDPSAAVSEERRAGNRYFDTLPMAILGIRDEEMSLLRCNNSYREFMEQTFGSISLYREARVPNFRDGTGVGFARAIRQCAKDGKRAFIEERIQNDTTIHALVRRIASNPVTGVTACNVIVLGIIKDTGQGVTYADIANSLSSDYIFLYYVNLKEETFTEYKPDPAGTELTVERHGTDFFSASLRDAKGVIDPKDLERFTSTFTKENVLRSLDENGAFTITYRLLIGEPSVYVHLKAVRMSRDKDHIIIGVSNIEAQMKTQMKMRKLQEEKVNFARLSALSGNAICIYFVNPETEEFIEYAATSDYKGLNTADKGEDFFEKSREKSKRAVHPDDQELFNALFTKEKVLEEIKANGLFITSYRLMLDGQPRYVTLQGGLVDENEGQRLIIAITDVDAQVRRDQQFRKKEE